MTKLTSEKGELYLCAILYAYLDGTNDRFARRSGNGDAGTREQQDRHQGAVQCRGGCSDCQVREGRSRSGGGQEGETGAEVVEIRPEPPICMIYFGNYKIRHGGTQKPNAIAVGVVFFRICLYK